MYRCDRCGAEEPSGGNAMTGGTHACPGVVGTGRWRWVEPGSAPRRRRLLLIVDAEVEVIQVRLQERLRGRGRFDRAVIVDDLEQPGMDAVTRARVIDWYEQTVKPVMRPEPWQPPPPIEKTYFGHKVIARHAAERAHPYPWMFTVTEPGGKVHRFAGVPNMCATARSALRRGWWRAKWLADGTFAQRYSGGAPDRRAVQGG